MKKRGKILLGFLGLFLANYACKKDVVVQKNESQILQQYLNLPASPFNYANPNLPPYLKTAQYQNIDNTPADNPVTDGGATLGRVLFYDKNLSQNKTVSCASCHVQEHGFSDPKIFSEGFKGGKTARHSMGLANARYYPNGHFFWDERAATLEQQVLMPIEDPIEMGMTLPELRTRLQALPYYSVLFERAFGDAKITDERMAKALAQFVRSMVSYNSKYDEGRKMVTNDIQPFPNFSPQENWGKALFSESNFACAACHGGEAHMSAFPANNGLDATTTDAGVGEHNGDPILEATFKAPSFRNILHRWPYMHDGRFANIDEVLEHYSTGIQPHPNLDQQLKDFDTGEPKKFNMTFDEKEALKAFLATLTDTVLLTDEKWNDPFK